MKILNEIEMPIVAEDHRSINRYCIGYHCDF